MAETNLKIDADEEGVWLSSSSRDFTQEEVAAFLRAQGVRKYDLKALEHFLREGTGERCKVANRTPSQEKDARILLEVSPDRMSASVLIDPPFFTKPWPSARDVLKVLTERKIVFGIDTEAVQRLVDQRYIDDYTVVARGQPVVEGRNASIELLLDPDHPFEIRDDERVDFWSRSSLITVHPGQEIAVKHPMEPGRNGKDIMGTVVKAKTVKNVDFAFGEGLGRSDENPLLLVATAEGQLKNHRGKLVVLPELEVNGDVDFGIGSIDFTGAVRIRGSVREGFHVVAQGNIDVHGTVEGAAVEGQAAIVIHGGVRGMGKGTIQAEGDVNVSFADQATIRSGGDIIVKNAILHSRLYARNAVKVLGKGKKSQIAGGRIEAGAEVSCNVLGSEMGTRTEVVVGLPPDQLEKRRILKAEVKRCEENLEKIEPNLVFLKNLEGTGQLDDQKRMIMVNLTKMKFQLQAALESMKLEVADLDFHLGMVSDRGIVRVKDICYPGVLISIRGVFYQVHEPCKFTSFIVDETGKAIVLRPFDYVIKHRSLDEDEGGDTKQEKSS